MLDNIKTPLLKTIREEVQTYNTQFDGDINIEMSLDTIMKENLTNVVELQRSISSSHMITIKDLAKKK